MPDIVEQVARALSAHWKDMHTNESLGRQRMLAGHAIAAVRKADAAARRVTVDADDLAETVERVLCLAEQEDDAGAFYVAKMIREPARRLQAAVDALEDE